MAKKPIKRRAKKATVVKTIEQTSAELKQFSHPDEAHPGELVLRVGEIVVLGIESDARFR